MHHRNNGFSSKNERYTADDMMLVGDDGIPEKYTTFLSLGN